MFKLRKLVALGLFFVTLSMGGCILWEGELMEIDGRYEKVYTDYKGRKYYNYKGRKKYLEEAQVIHEMHQDDQILREAERFDNSDY